MHESFACWHAHTQYFYRILWWESKPGLFHRLILRWRALRPTTSDCLAALPQLWISSSHWETFPIFLQRGLSRHPSARRLRNQHTSSIQCDTEPSFLESKCWYVCTSSSILAWSPYIHGVELGLDAATCSNFVTDAGMYFSRMFFRISVYKESTNKVWCSSSFTWVHTNRLKSYYKSTLIYSWTPSIYRMYTFILKMCE